MHLSVAKWSACFKSHDQFRNLNIASYNPGPFHFTRADIDARQDTRHTNELFTITLMLQCKNTKSSWFFVCLNLMLDKISHFLTFLWTHASYLFTDGETSARCSTLPPATTHENHMLIWTSIRQFLSTAAGNLSYCRWEEEEDDEEEKKIETRSNLRKCWGWMWREISVIHINATGSHLPEGWRLHVIFGADKLQCVFFHTAVLQQGH